MPLFPLPRFFLLPHTVMPLHVFEPRYVRLVEDALRDRKLIGMIQFADPWNGAELAVPSLERIGCAGRITDLTRRPDGRFDMKLFGVGKFEIQEEIRQEPYRAATIRWIPDLNENAEGEAADGAVRSVLHALDAAAEVRGEEPESRSLLVSGLPFAARVNTLALASRLDPEEFQGLLDLRDVYARARRIEKLLLERVAAARRTRCFRRHAPDDPRVN